MCVWAAVVAIDQNFRNVKLIDAYIEAFIVLVAQSVLFDGSLPPSVTVSQPCLGTLPALPPRVAEGITKSLSLNWSSFRRHDREPERA
jgi:hypothetical protein